MAETVLVAVGDGDVRGLLLQLAARSTGFGVDVLRIVSRCPRCGSADHGAPSVVTDDGRTLAASLSRSRGRVLAAVTDGPRVGVDVEHREAADRDLRGVVADAVPPSRRLVTWVRTEAVLKALGTGLALDPRTLDLGDPSAEQGVARVGDRELAWTDLDAGPDHVAALAVAAPADPVVEIAPG